MKNISRGTKKGSEVVALGTSETDDQGMFLGRLGTILETDPLSMIQQTIFHR
jgi:hypothetical protein